MDQRIKDTKEMIKVMKAYINGAEIEYREVGKATWIDSPYPLWAWSTAQYRIKRRLK